jgi:hypothetical protein
MILMKHEQYEDLRVFSLHYLTLLLFSYTDILNLLRYKGSENATIVPVCLLPILYAYDLQSMDHPPSISVL